jgi:hypothetical protein
MRTIARDVKRALQMDHCDIADPDLFNPSEIEAESSFHDDTAFLPPCHPSPFEHLPRPDLAESQLSRLEEGADSDTYAEPALETSPCSSLYSILAASTSDDDMLRKEVLQSLGGASQTTDRPSTQASPSTFSVQESDSVITH